MKREKWGIANRCPQCSWIASPEGDIGLLEVMRPRRNCPACGSKLVAFDYICPNCEKPMPSFRMPKDLSMALWGGTCCPECGVRVDKWGRVTPA